MVNFTQKLHVEPLWFINDSDYDDDSNLNQGWSNVGPTLETVGQQLICVGLTCRVCWNDSSVADISS